MVRMKSLIVSGSNCGYAVDISICQVLTAPAPSNGRYRSSWKFSSNSPESDTAELVAMEAMLPMLQANRASLPRSSAYLSLSVTAPARAAVVFRYLSSDIGTPTVVYGPALQTRVALAV